jgi:hypothetical protein
MRDGEVKHRDGVIPILRGKRLEVDRDSKGLPDNRNTATEEGLRHHDIMFGILLKGKVCAGRYEEGRRQEEN